MKQPDGDNPGSGSGVVLLSGECRPLRRALRPLVWVVLEEVALDAVVEDGGLVARTSARQVAERLGVEPGTAATALRVLRPSAVSSVSSARRVRPAVSVCRSTSSARRPGCVSSNHVRRSHSRWHRPWWSRTRLRPLVASPCVAESCGIVEVETRTWSGQPPAVGSPVRRPITTAPTPPTDKVRPVVQAPRPRPVRLGIARGRRRWISGWGRRDGAGGCLLEGVAGVCRGLAGGGDGMVVGGVMEVGMGVMAVDGDGMVDGDGVGGGGGC